MNPAVDRGRRDADASCQPVLAATLLPKDHPDLRSGVSLSDIPHDTIVMPIGIPVKHDYRMSSSDADRHGRRFGAWLEAQLRNRGFNQSEFARRLGVSQGTVSRWVNGRVPDAEYIEKISDVLVVDYDVVATEAGIRPRELLNVDPDSATAQLMPLIEKIDWDTDPGRLEGVRMILEGYLEVDRRRKAGKK